MEQYIYVSKATKKPDLVSLTKLLLQVRRCNRERGITGILIYHEGSFVQVLEGKATVLEAVYRKINRDKRHENIKLLARREIEERQFATWSMCFVDSINIPELRNLDEYINFKDLTLHDIPACVAKRILGQFRRGRWRQSGEPAVAARTGIDRVNPARIQWDRIMQSDQNLIPGTC